MKNAKANTNFTTKILQIDVIVIWSVSLKLYNKWMFEYFFFKIDNMLVCKTYIVSLAHFGWIIHINKYEKKI